VFQKEVDGTLLHPTLQVCRRQLSAAGIRPKLATVVADSGYVSEAAFAQAHAEKLRLLAPVTKDTRAMRDGGDPAGGRPLGNVPETARGQRRLRHHRGRADYRPPRRPHHRSLPAPRAPAHVHRLDSRNHRGRRSRMAAQQATATPRGPHDRDRLSHPNPPPDGTPAPPS
jgi:hypothetical protein